MLLGVHPVIWVILAVLILAALLGMVRGAPNAPLPYQQLDDRLKRMETRMEQTVGHAQMSPMLERVSGVERQVNALQERVGAVERQVGGVQDRMGALERQVSELAGTISGLIHQMRNVDNNVQMLVQHQLKREN